MSRLIIELLVPHGLALRRVTDADDGDATEISVVCFPLTESRVDLAHELTSDHANFIDDNEARVFEILLETVEGVCISNVSEGQGHCKPVDKSVDRRCLEAEVEG